jgi:hypothetical protein
VIDKDEREASAETCSREVGANYERPQLLLLGNLHDLLAGDGSTHCDSASSDLTTGHDVGGNC